MNKWSIKDCLFLKDSKHWPQWYSKINKKITLISIFFIIEGNIWIDFKISVIVSLMVFCSLMAFCSLMFFCYIFDVFWNFGLSFLKLFFLFKILLHFVYFQNLILTRQLYFLLHLLDFFYLIWLLLRPDTTEYLTLFMTEYLSLFIPLNGYACFFLEKTTPIAPIAFVMHVIKCVGWEFIGT